MGVGELGVLEGAGVEVGVDKCIWSHFSVSQGPHFMPTWCFHSSPIFKHGPCYFLNVVKLLIFSIEEAHVLSYELFMHDVFSSTGLL